MLFVRASRCEIASNAALNFVRARHLDWHGVTISALAIVLIVAFLVGCERPVYIYNVFVPKQETRSEIVGIELIDPNHLLSGTLKLYIDSSDLTRLHLKTALRIMPEKANAIDYIAISCIKDDELVFEVQVQVDNSSTFLSPAFHFPIDFPPSWLENACLMVEPIGRDGERMKEIRIELRGKKSRVRTSVVQGYKEYTLSI